VLLLPDERPFGVNLSDIPKTIYEVFIVDSGG
jgi:hypothetical protein